jgi:opacity protein-like surface antigen
VVKTTRLVAAAVAVVTSVTFTSVNRATAADPSALPPVAVATPMAYDWYGVYVGGHAGGARVHDTWAQTTPNFLTSGTIDSSGGFGGGQIGINNWIVTRHLLLGLEADISGSSIAGSMTNAPGSGALLGWNENIDVFGTLRGRLGYAQNNWLVYATGGLAWDNDSFTRTQIVQTPVSPPAGDARTNWSLRAGWTAGAGIEWGFFGNWTARVEYLHVDLDGPRFVFQTINANGTMVSRAVDEGRLTMDMVRVGVNYLFK